LKESLLEEIKVKEIEFESARHFLAELKKKFGEGNNKSVKEVYSNVLEFRLHKQNNNT